MPKSSELVIKVRMDFGAGQFLPATDVRPYTTCHFSCPCGGFVHFDDRHTAICTLCERVYRYQTVVLCAEPPAPPPPAATVETTWPPDAPSDRYLRTISSDLAYRHRAGLETKG